MSRIAAIAVLALMPWMSVQAAVPQGEVKQDRDEGRAMVATAPAADTLNVLPGFKAELVYSVPA